MQHHTGGEKQQQLYRLSLLVIGIILSVSGLYLQIHYHLLKAGGSAFSGWTLLHKGSALIFTFLLLPHIIQHFKWYKGVFRKQLFRKNRFTLFLTAIMIMVSLSGFISWTFTLRHTLIEVHDKIGVIFIAIMIGHIIKKWK